MKTHIDPKTGKKILVSDNYPVKQRQKKKVKK